MPVDLKELRRRVDELTEDRNNMSQEMFDRKIILILYELLAVLNA